MKQIQHHQHTIDSIKYKHRLIGKVKSFEVDRQNIVHNAIYIYWLEESRIEYFRSIGISIDSETFITKDRFVVAKNEVNYVSPAQFDQSYILLTRVSEIHNSSIIFDQIILSYPDNQLIVQATGVLVNLNPITNAPERIHDDYRKLVIAYEDYAVLQ
jgi:YbgC/YbaW family acyl-CoA thioester hydrolase